MSGRNGVAEISEALGLAWKVYEQGWVHDRSPNPQLAKFGEEIQKLAESLSNVVRIVENARICYQQHAIRSPTFRGFFVQKEWNLTSLHEICGNFKATISECEQLLAQNRDVYRNDSSAYSEEWILVMKPKLEELCQRLRIHNSKLSIVLKPLETRLLADVQQEFAATQQSHHPMQGIPAFPLQGLVVLNIDQSLQDYRQPPMVRFDISPDLEAQVRAFLEQSKPEVRTPGSLRLIVGADLFIEFYEQSTKCFAPGNFVSERKPTPKQYINLLNCLFILQNLQQSQELRYATQDSIWPFFIGELGSTLRSECQRFSSRSPERLLVPDLPSVQRELRGPREAKVSKEDVSKLLSPHFETYSQPVLSIPLPSPQDGIARQLSVARVDSTKLRLIEAAHEESDPSVRLGEIVMDIDLKSVQLTPIYATPSSRPRPFEVLLHTGTGQLNPTFCEAKHIYRLQHLLTGYKVYDRYDQAMVKVTFFISGESSPLEEHGRIQLWLPQPFNSGDKPVVPNVEGTPSGSSASAIQDQPAAVATQSAPESVKRSSSFRKWVPSLRRGSNGQDSSRERGATNSTFMSPISPVSSSQNNPAPFPSGPYELPVEAQQQSYGQAYDVNSNIPYAINTETLPNTHVQASWPSPAQRISAYQPFGIDDLPEISEPSQQPQGLDYRHIPFSGPPRYGNFTQSAHPAQPAQPAWPYSPDSLASPSAPWLEDRSTHPPAQHQRSMSNISMPSLQSQQPSHQNKPPSTIKASPSVVSTRSTRSHSSMASSVSTIKTSTGYSSVSSSGVARMHHKPQKPLLVLFLKSRDPSAKLSIVAIQIDSHTTVVRERCDCYNSHSTCRISCLERSTGKGLLAQRWEADSGLSSFNVAKLGEHQRKDAENLWPNLKRISLRFEKMEDRYRFAGSPCACNVQTTHALSKCNLQSHNGVYGIVKQIGDQMLLNYHNERNSALTKPMVLAPLSEGEI